LGKFRKFHGFSSVSFFFAHGRHCYERQSCGRAADFGLVADLTLVSKKPPGFSRLLVAGRR
jgi:hypothetical protein